MKNNRLLVVLGSLVAVAAVIGFSAVTGLWPPKSGTEGAIGAANRYQATQITPADVTLDDAKIQAFMQTEVFHKIATDARFRKLILQKDFVEMARNPTVFSKVDKIAKKTVFHDKDFAELLKSGKLHSKNVAAHFKNIHSYSRKNKFGSDDAFAEMLRNPKVHSFLAEAEEAAKRGKEVQDTEGYAELFETGDYAELAKTNKTFFNKILADAAGSDAVELADLAEALNKTKLIQDSEGLAELLDDAEMYDLVTSEEAAKSVQAGTNLLSNKDTAELMNVFSENAELLESADMLEMAKKGLFADAVAEMEKTTKIR